LVFSHKAEAVLTLLSAQEAAVAVVDIVEAVLVALMAILSLIMYMELEAEAPRFKAFLGQSQLDKQ
jgi:hypothetical protein